MTTEQTLTPAEELRAAASKIRDLIVGIPAGPWSMRDSWRSGDETVHVRRIANADHEDVLTASGRADLVGLPSTFEHIALWHPGVAELVAVALDEFAASIKGLRTDPFGDGNSLLNIARAINGGAR